MLPSSVLPVVWLTLPWLVSAALGRAMSRWTDIERVVARGGVGLVSVALGAALLQQADALGGETARPLYGSSAVALFGVAPAALAGVAYDGWRADRGPLRTVGVVAGVAALTLLGMFAIAVAMAGAVGGGGMVG